MIQRIQTLYLLIVTALQVILFFSSMATITLADNQQLMIKCTNSEFLVMAILIALTALLAFFSIFLYRKCVLQIRINVYNLILLLAVQGFLVYYLIKITAKSSAISYSIPVIFPIVSAVLTFLAIRSIGKDAAVLKASNRIRK